MAVGDRVAAARAQSGLTQVQLASAVGLARSALAKVETGTRRVSAVELIAIARELHRRVEWFVDDGPPAIVSYRTANPTVATQLIDDELDRVVRDVEFVSGLSPQLLAGTPATQSRPLSSRDAEDLASTVRGMMGLSPDQPALDLAGLCGSVGLLVFSLRLGAGADAGTVLLTAGGVSVVNGDLERGRRRLALAHELGHYVLADPYSTDWRVAASDSEALESRLDRFARALLLPASDLRVRWRDWVATPGESLRDAAVRAGSHYRVDMSTLARRLDELGLAEGADADAIRQVRTKKSDIVEKSLTVHYELEPVGLPRQYERAVLELYRRELVTVDRALGLLMATFDEDGLPDLPPADEGEIWSLTS